MDFDSPNPMRRWPEFVLLHAFAKAWDGLDLSDEQLSDLQSELMARPRAGAVIAGTGGVRKLRLAVHSGKGKRGGARLAYVYFGKLSVIGLLFLYVKNERADLSKEDKEFLKLAVERLEAYLLDREGQ